MDHKIKQNSALNLIPQKKRQDIDAFVSLLSELRGVKAIGLGGSYARNTATPESDIDIGLYYSDSQPFEISDIQEIVKKIHKNGEAGTVTQLYEWGAWVNGGAWIETESGKVDLLYRSLEHLDRVIQESSKGINSCDYLQQAPYGFYSVTYLGETATCVPIYDPENLIQAMKEKVKVYPEALKKGIIQQNLWSVEFTLLHAKKCASRNDIYTTAGCVTRSLSCLTQVLFALNGEYFISDREAMNSIDSFEISIDGYRKDVETIIEQLGCAEESLKDSIQNLEGLFFKVKELAGTFYTSKYRIG